MRLLLRRRCCPIHGFLSTMVLSFIVYLQTVAAAETTATIDDFDKHDWYTRYPAYPEYCSTPQHMATRSIPPLLQDHSKYGETRLVHASVIIRHGARTPWGTEAKCWEGYWENSETAVWDCRLTQFVAPPSDKTVESDEDLQPTDNDASDAVFLFEKKYDAFLRHPDNDHGDKAHDENLSNKLNGTCQIGQLLLQGYEQQLLNGHHLRNAYCYNGANDFDHDVRMRLLDLTDSSSLFKRPNLSYRSDDDERTVMSGQVLLRGMFEQEFIKYKTDHDVHPIISLHTADRERDVLSANPKICPLLNDLWQESQDSRGFQQLDNSKEAKELKTFMKKHLGQVMDNDPVDCLMTTICTDRPLPDAINDYRGGDRRKLHQDSDSENCGNNSNNCTTGDDEGLDDAEYQDDTFMDDKVPDEQDASSSSGKDKSDDMDTSTNYFQRIYEYSVKRFIYGFLYNNAAYSKLGISPLWREIMQNIVPIIDPNRYDRYNEPPETTKLALFSGHDTTIVPLMATLGKRVWNETDWPPYASMMIIEIHEIIDGLTDRTIFKSDFAFRLLYNGKVMTPLVDGCEPDVDLCDAKILENRILPMAMKPWNCDSGFQNPLVGAWAETEHLLSTTGGVLLFLIIICTSGALGGVATFVYLTRRLPFTNKKIFAKGVIAHDEQGISLTQGSGNENGTESSLYGSADTSPSADAGRSKDAVTLIT